MKSKSLFSLVAIAALAAVAVAAQAAGVDIGHAVTQVLPALADPSVQAGLAMAGAAGITTFVQPGDVLELTPAADVSSGQGYLFGAALFGVAADNVTSGAPGRFVVEGVVTIAKTSALAIAVGDRVFWDATNKCVNKTVTAQQQVGICVVAAANPSATVQIRLESAVPVAT